MEADAFMMTRIPTETFSILWTIDQFNNFFLGEYESVRSATFHPPGAEKLGFALELRRDPDDKRNILINWLLVDIPDGEEHEELKVQVKVQLFVFEKKADHLLTVSAKKEGRVWSKLFIKVVPDVDVFEDGNIAMLESDPPKILTIRFEMKLFNRPIRYGVATTSRGYAHYTQLIDDLQNIFENKEFVDCVLIAGGEEFPASRAILAARSPVFKTMFTGSFEEAKTFRAEIDDISANVMRKLLEYIYKGSVEEMDECADGLLAAGHRYQVEGIQQLAAEALAKEIAVENVCQLFARADLYGAPLLKSQCSSYIAQHRRAVIKTEPWKTLVAGSNAHLLAELIEGAAEVEETV